MGETSAPVCPHHNEIDLLFLRCFNNLVKWDTMHNAPLPLDPSGSDACEVGLHVMRDFGFKIVEKC